MIAIIDYGMGNLRSVQKAFEYLGHKAVITSDSIAVKNADSIILPGVGAFKESVKAIRNKSLDRIIYECVETNKPLLGICLGMQLLFERSFEDGVHEGLGIIKGDITRFDIDEKVPHIGWNAVDVTGYAPLYNGISDKNFYFVHSYCAVGINPDANGITNYGVDFTSSVSYGSVHGVQFHPEKSGDSGLKLLDNFAKLNR